MAKANPEKRRLRRKALARRDALNPSWRDWASGWIQDQLLASEELLHAHTIGLYASIRSEVGTTGLIEELLRRRYRVALPCVLRELHQMELRVVDRFPRGCHPGAFGVVEPDPMHHPEVIEVEEVDVLLVPGVLFDRRGYRIGYGGGYYDQLLIEEHDHVKIGLAFGCQVIDRIPNDPWDRPLNQICTEEGMIETHTESMEFYYRH